MSAHSPIRSLREQEPFAGFFERLSAASQKALLLDFDGTLAPFDADRAQVRMYPGVRSAILALALEGECRVAIVSGRSVSDLRRAVDLDGCVELWGSHGLERLTVEGEWTGPPLSPATSRFAGEMLGALAQRWPGVLEQKPYGVALHLRGRPPGLVEDVRSELRPHWAQKARGAGLEIVDFDGGIELRPVGGDKGLVVRRTFQELGEGAAIAYLGDDQTDEDAFRELRGRGLTVLVRPRRRPTFAEAWLRPPEELLAFLLAWNECCVGARSV